MVRLVVPNVENLSRGVWAVLVKLNVAGSDLRLHKLREVLQLHLSAFNIKLDFRDWSLLLELRVEFGLLIHRYVPLPLFVPHYRENGLHYF